MKTIQIVSSTVLGLLFITSPALALTTSVAASVNAQIGSTTVSVNAQTRITTAKSRANQEIARRVNILTQLNTNVQTMVKVSAAEKSAITTKVQTEISDLNSLNAKIQADTAVAGLHTDIQSITQDYRIFMLVVPQGRIEVAADKIQTIASSYAALSIKLQARISQAPSGTNTTQASAWLSDMNSKVSDANAQAQAAVSFVANLQPDQGNVTVEASNKAALQSARADIKTALADLKAARSDAGSLVKAIESWKVSASASSTTSTR